MRFSVLWILIGVMAVACSSDEDPAPQPTNTEFQREGTLSFHRAGGSVIRTIEIEIAETDRERNQGLMFRRELGYERGMLFLFEEANTNGFWMKNTPLPLDILFVDPDSQIINIAKRTTPFSSETIRPEAPKQYVVEVRGGFTTRFGIEPGMTISWERER